ncbi:DNA-formamidopyrimidine glycosylase [Patescibacteria group bacterium]|nr:DNA-formamidopyrimidine glycosylase [Patescibacteria group bacterium]MBU1931515.1 DNA-formamidopyrimidine glycosylase [Patescibacteria group bacterium]
MPELPEVETIRRGLAKKIVGKTIAGIEVRRTKSWQGNKQLVIGKKIIDVKRRAKILLIQLHGGEAELMIHLKMTGQLIYNMEQLPHKYTRAIIQFSDGAVLFFNDLRLFGWIKVVKIEDLAEELKIFSGVEPLSKKFTASYLIQVLGATKRAIKLVLMDQKKIAGIGNIYANEALFCARIDPRQPAKNIVINQPKKLVKLHFCIVKILRQAIKYRGTTSSDEAFRDVGGKRGQMQKHLLVYGKKGEACSNCGGIIKWVKLGGRGTFFCPDCQK